MSGPALKKVDHHAAIHEAALNEAKELTDLLRILLESGQTDQALKTAYVTLEHWESRTLVHADSEESGLYREFEEKLPESHDTAVALTRDHDLLRLLAEEIRKALGEGHFGQDELQKFYALIQVDRLHNHDEEQWIFRAGEP